MKGHGRWWFGLVVVVVTAGLTWSVAVAAPPKTISFQGYLKDGTGKPVTTATNLTFRLYSSTRSNSGPLWSETQTGVPFSNGVYSVLLGSQTPFDSLLFDVPYYLGISVGGGNELTPRQPLTSAPYAFRAGVSGVAERVSSSNTLVFQANGQNVFRIEPNATSPNIAAGNPANTAGGSGVVGAIVSGGGSSAMNCSNPATGKADGSCANSATANFATVSGGLFNTASGFYSTVSGGAQNTTSGWFSTVSGGQRNTTSDWSDTVSGGQSNTANGGVSTVSGGESNTASGFYSTVTGGFRNQAGGDYSLAAGRHAKVRDKSAAGNSTGDAGTFVWNSQDADFISTGQNQFLIRAQGGVGINTNTPREALDVAGNIRINDKDIYLRGNGGDTNHGLGWYGYGIGRQFKSTTFAEGPVLYGFTAGALGTTNGSGTIALKWQDNGDVTVTGVLSGNGSGLTNLNLANAWKTTGNSGMVPGTNFIGTTDNQPLEIKVNNQRVVRLEPKATSPNITVGSPANTAGGSGVGGATVSGGGSAATNCYNPATGLNDRSCANSATNSFAVVGGGLSNSVSGPWSVISGGEENTASGEYSTIGGGWLNIASGSPSTIGGGDHNTASGLFSTICGGSTNTASGIFSAISGGWSNTASGRSSTVSGGESNQAGGDYSQAAGYRARVRDKTAAGNTTGDTGTFIWADSQDADFISSGQNQFLIRAQGGVGINTNTPREALDVMGNVRINDKDIYLRGNGGDKGHGLGWYGYGIGRQFKSTTFAEGPVLYGFTAGALGTTNGSGNIALKWQDNGNVTVYGTLSKAGGSFKIDHPLDPRHRYLSHSFVESPDMKNIYDGVITTNEQGFATIELPEWFEALNRDFRYQVTVIGKDSWARARVFEEIADNRFVIQTDLPATKVSWQVTGIRKDAWAESHRIRVEEEKPQAEQGSCLHAEACQ